MVRLALLLVLLAAPAAAQDTAFRASMVAAVAAHGADLATTEYCLGAGTCLETNPALMRFSTQPAVFGAAKMGVAGLSLWLTAKLHESHPRWAQAANWIMAGAFSAIAVHNTRVGKVGR